VLGYLAAGSLTTSSTTPGGTKVGYGEASTLGLSTFAGVSVDSTSLLI
jgi:hypothetical protein